MHVLTFIQIPNEPFNTLTRHGDIGDRLGRVVEETKPEAIYFTEMNGHRGAVAVYQLEHDSDVPRISEPWFLTFEADCQFRIAMTPQDLRKAGLDALGKKWAA
jgi:hypothetical protein